MSLFETHNYSCSIYREGIKEENAYAKLEEPFRSRLFRVFARDGCDKDKQKISSITRLVKFPSKKQEQGK